VRQTLANNSTVRHETPPSRSNRSRLDLRSLHLAQNIFLRSVGLQVLRLAIADPDISSITLLSQWPLPDYVPTSTKVQVIVLEDFLHYPPNVLLRLADHDACIWASGVARRNILKNLTPCLPWVTFKRLLGHLTKAG